MALHRILGRLRERQDVHKPRPWTLSPGASVVFVVRVVDQKFIGGWAGRVLEDHRGKKNLNIRIDSLRHRCARQPDLFMSRHCVANQGAVLRVEPRALRPVHVAAVLLGHGEVVQAGRDDAGPATK